MSDEHAKTVDPRPFNWGTPEKITAFFCVNLIAAYEPAVVCVMDLGPKENVALAYKISPVLFGAIATSTPNLAGVWFFLAALILLLFWASAALRTSWKALVAIPSLVFVYSLLQGMLAVGILNALDGIAH